MGGARRAVGGFAAALALSATAPPLAAAAPAATTLLYERTLMVEADRRCRLFAPDIDAALSAAAAQARGAALRAGASDDTVLGAEQRARAKAYAVACGAPDLQLAAARVRAAFKGYAAMTAMSFPGAFADWRAERPRPAAASRPPRPGPQWRLVQFSPQGVRPTLFGLSAAAPGAPAMLTVVRPGDEALSAITARLVLRDPAKDDGPYLDPRRRDLAGRLAPRALDQVFLARSRTPAPRALLPPDARSGAVFQFPSEAIAALAALDPRDAAAVEFVYPAPGGERVETAWFEVGDFAAAEAFLAVNAPAPPQR